MFGELINNNNNNNNNSRIVVDSEKNRILMSKMGAVYKEWSE